MAQGAVLLILFAFMMCLSCLSSSAVGSGVFYACSDGTMSPGEFDLKKCLNFGISDVVSATEEITGLETTTVEPADAAPSELGSLIPDRPADLDDENPDNTYLDFFGAGKTARISGVPVVATASSKAECARICYNSEVPMNGEGEQCNGFVSDGFSRCILYPSSDVIAGTTLPKDQRSYVLKNARSGQQSISFAKQNFVTDFVQDSKGGERDTNGDYGTPAFMGYNTDVTCEKDGTNGLLTGFRSAVRGGNVGFRYSCLLSDTVQRKPGVTTNATNQGQRNSCGGKQKGRRRHNGSDIGFLNQHEVDCLDSFIQSWGVRPEGGWKNGSMRVKYTCTNLETPDAAECQDLETEGNFGGRPCRLSNLRNSPVQCPANMALTQFRINHPSGKISYRCCPKPAEGGTTTYSRSSSALG